MLLVSLCRIYSSLLICFISFLYFCLVSKDKLPDNQTLISLKCFCLCFVIGLCRSFFLIDSIPFTSIVFHHSFIIAIFKLTVFAVTLFNIRL